MRKKIIVVLGMHRSGTSAITRGLQTLGVNLGSSLIPPDDNNEKGFFEDIEINSFNNQLLSALGSDWHALSFIPSSLFEQENLLPLKLRAIELMRTRIGEQPFGMKDPRIGRLLPFWHAVFNSLNVSPSYLIAIRHSMSVARSLKKRDGFDHEKSYYLWIEHIIPTMLETVGANRVVVDFDLLMADPQAQLKRVAQALDLPFNSDSSKLKEYIGEFLDTKLRHTQFEIGDLGSDPAVPLDVISAYEMLNRLARDEINIDAPEVVEIFGQLNARLRSLAPAFNYITLLERKISDRDSEIMGLNQGVSDRDSEIMGLKQGISDRDSEIISLNQGIADRDGQIAILIAEREHILDSTSWKITMPLRAVRRSTVFSPIRLMRKIISDGARWAWLKLPLSYQHKSLLKNKLFDHFPFLFCWSRAYRSWAAMKVPSATAPDLMNNQGASLVSGVASDVYVPLLQVLPTEDVPVRLIAFYLPQFHPIIENNTWWGEGFTEWTNVKPALPQFGGHFQPHIPGELGYYNLLDGTTQYRQIELAKLYGIGGFCFYMYWFGGKLLLEKPVENYLNDHSLDLPFCLCWANENWSRRWDGLESEILIAQNHSPEDDLAFIKYVSQYMRDQRYICIDGKPLLLVYRPSLLPSPKKTAKRWRQWCLKNGIGEIYLAYTQSFETVDPSKYGFDAAIEFPPNNSSPPDITETVKPLNNFCGTVYDWRVFVERSRSYQKPAYKLFRSVCPSWDNTARRKNTGTIFLNSTPSGYQEWLGNAVAETCDRIINPDERLVFVNAWNEWAEGAHLEPDTHYGYAYLEATRRVLTGETDSKKKQKIIIVSHDAHPHGAQFLALGIARSLKQDLRLAVEVVLLGGGRLAPDFEVLAPVHNVRFSRNAYEAIRNLANSLAQRGFTKAIVNTTVSGEVIPMFRDAGIESICLVHELPGVIQSYRLENHVKQIATYAKKVVFPAQVVAEGFSGFAAVDGSKKVIRPQGLYRRNKWRFEKLLAKSKLCEQLGLNPDTKIVLTVGYADHRKGVDLFVECALSILATRNDTDFVWVGHWEQGMQKEIENKLLKNPCANKIHFVGYNPQTDLFHAASDVYALTSREDPFPNVVLESFDAGVPVVAFADTGGAAHLVAKVGGFVVPALDMAKYSAAICHLLDNSELSVCLGEAAQNHVDEHFAFRPYLFDLCGMLGINLPKVSVIIPNYNYAQYIEERLNSIRNQSVPVFELIILDDASTDQSISKISGWLASTLTDARVVINQTNSGSVFAQWQKGVSLARGDCVWIAEADDLSDPDFLEVVLPPLVSGEAVLSYCDSQQIDSCGTVQARNYQDYLRVVSEEKWKGAYIASGAEECRSSLAILNTIPNVSAVVFKRDVISAVMIQHFEEIAHFRKAGDWIVYIHALSHGNIAFSPRTANSHRRHGGSVIGNSVDQDLLQEIAEIQLFVEKKHQVVENIRLRAADYIISLQTRLAPIIPENHG